MAQIPVYTRLTLGDSPDAPSWVPGMYQTLNTFAEQTINAFKQNLTIGTNIQGGILQTTFTTDAAYSTGTFIPIKLNYSGGNVPNVLIVGKITESTGSLILTPVTVTSWFANINTLPTQLNINYIAGLVNSKTYTVTFLAL